MHQQFFTPLEFLPPTAVRIGRLISSIRRPSDSFVDPQYAQETLDQATKQQNILSLSIKTASASNHSAAVGLGRIFSLSAGTQGTSNVTYNLRDVEHRFLENCDAFFREAVKQAAVKEWLAEKSGYSSPVYMIAGYATASALNVNEINNQRTVTQLEGKFSPNSAIAGIGRSIVKSHINLQAAGATANNNTVDTATEVNEMTVWALRYRKVKFRFLKRTHEMTQGDEQWTVLLSKRGEGDEGVFLVDGQLESEDEDSLEEDMVSGGEDYEKYEDENGNVFLVSLPHLGEDSEGDDASDSEWET